MDESILKRVKSSLNAQFYVTNDTWLRECVGYYLSVNNNPTHGEALRFVISQWQLSDLREISNEKPCLPANLAQEKSTTLKGHFILQIEKIYDIAESKYKQLEKIRNVSNENIQVTDAEQTQAWEPKKNRMLQLHLTDGTQDITAIENQPIRFLHPNLVPGLKVMIKGPVTCRRGIILLNEGNISEIGGEVESLLIPNALENVLARALNLEENPDPYSDATQPEPESTPAAAPEPEMFDDDFEIDMVDVAVLETRSQATEVAGPAALVKPSNNLHPANRNEPPNRGNREAAKEIQLNRPCPTPLNERTDSDMMFDMIDDRLFQSVTETHNSAAANEPGSASMSSKNALKPSESQNAEFSDDYMIFDNIVGSVPASTKKSRSTAKVLKDFQALEVAEFPDENFNDFDDDDVIFDNVVEEIPASPSDARDIRVTCNVPKRTEFRDLDFPENEQHWSSPVITKPTFDRSISKRVNEEPEIMKDPNAIIEKTCLTNHHDLTRQLSFDKKATIGGSAATASSILNSSPVKICSSTAQVPDRPQTKDSALTRTKRPASVFSSPIASQPAGKIRCDRTTPKISKINKKITDFLTKDDSIEDVTVKTHDNICELVSVIDTNTAVQYKTIKGKVKSMDTLTRNGQFWKLGAIIEDATGSIEVEFASEILERLLGFTVLEFSQKKKLKKTNPEIEKELRQGFRNAESKFVRLKGLLDIELTPGAKPKVVKIKEAFDEQMK